MYSESLSVLFRNSGKCFDLCFLFFCLVFYLVLHCEKNFNRIYVVFSLFLASFVCNV
jgi:hypothetical protein